MIFALIGPDGVGKSTMFKQLASVFTEIRAVPGVRTFEEELTIMPLIERRMALMLSALYSADSHILTDRIVFVDAFVYSSLYNRKVHPDVKTTLEELRNELALIYLRPDKPYIMSKSDKPFKEQVEAYDYAILSVVRPYHICITTKYDEAYKFMKERVQ